MRVLGQAILIAVIAGGLGCAGAARQTALAETDIGPITFDDLEYQLRHWMDLPEGEMETPSDWRQIPRILRRCAYEQILFHIAEERGLLEDPVLGELLVVNDERILSGHAERTLIHLPSYPTREEMWGEVHRRREENRLPPQVSWRFMLVADAERAHEAIEALDAGEEFQGVARRLGSPVAAGEPGDLVGPTELEGNLFAEVEQALLNLPPGEVSEPIETPAGTLLLLVEEREIERFRSDSDLMLNFSVPMADRRREEYRAQLLPELAEKHGVEIHEPLTDEMPDDTPALTVGDRTLTLGQLRLRAASTVDPETALAWWMTPMGRVSLVGDQLLICELDVTGVTSSPEMRQRLALSRHSLTLEQIERLFHAERIVEPSPEEIEAYHAEHGEEFVRDLHTVEALWISHATLGRLASSEMGIARLREAQALRERWVAGENPQALLREIGIDREAGDGGGRWEGRSLDAMPRDVREIVPTLESGEFSDVLFGPVGALIVHRAASEPGVPRLDDIWGEVRSAIVQAQLPDLPFLDELLERHHYRQLVDETRLRWVDEMFGELTLLPTPE
jgi:PPIC-type PPIASE domain